MAFYEVIKFDGQGVDWLLYKHSVDEFNNNSRLIVSPGQVAIIVHNGKLEKICEDGTFKINSEFLPFLKGFTKPFFGGSTPYPIEIYFINKRVKLDLLWGTSDPVKLIDPKYNIQINVRARGQLGIKLDNYQYFFQTLVGTLMKNQIINFSIIQTFFRSKINQIIKKELSKYILNNKITYFEIDLHIDDIQKLFEEELKDEFEQYGFRLINLAVDSINVPAEDLDKLNEILHKKAEYDQLGDQVYRTTRGYDILEAGAENNAAAATMMGIGMGMNITGNGGQAQSIIPPMNNESSQFNCPVCNTLIDAKSKFCPECGTKIITNCPNCGTKLDPKQKFCPECGTKIYGKGE